MKKLFLLLFLFFSVGIKAQFITLPDAQFAYQLQISLGCVSGTQLDTVCAANATGTGLYIMVSHVQNLTGIQYFHNLKSLSCSPGEVNFLSSLPPNLEYLDCGGNDITVIPPLPSTLKYLDCLGNQLTALPNLPTGLTYLNCIWNQIPTLPTLPDSLDHLECGANPLLNLPALPAHLTYLDCGGTPLTSLPALPNTLQHLSCGGTNLTTLPTLPSSLISILCQNAPLTSLPALPSSFRSLQLYQNQLTSLPPLPNSLRTLECAHNLLTSLPELPDTLNSLWCSSNPLTCLPKLKTILYQASLDSTNITCVPNYGEIRFCYPPLSSFPLCDDSLNNACSVFWNITGKVFYDVNTNCVNDTGDQHQINIVLNLFHNGVLEKKTFTEKGGNYSFDVSNYGTYIVRVDSSYGNIVTCPDTGYYTIEVTQSDSLFYQVDFGIDTNIFNRIVSVTGRPSFSLFPNPATDNINITIEENMIGGFVTVSDVTGRKMTAVQLATLNTQLPTSDFANGIYFVSVEVGRERITKKIVIEK